MSRSCLNIHKASNMRMIFMLVSWIKSVLHAIHGSFSRNIFGVQASDVSFFAIYIAFVLRLENVLLARFPPSYPFSSFLRDSLD